MTLREGSPAPLTPRGGDPTGVLLPFPGPPFTLAIHAGPAPAEGTIVAAHPPASRIPRPRPGEPFEPTAESVPSTPWWRTVAPAPKDGWPTTEALTAATIKVGADVAKAEAAKADRAEADVAKDAGLGRTEGTGEPEAVPAG